MYSLSNQKSIKTFIIGGTKEADEMLKLHSKYNIVSDVEIINIKDINDTYQDLFISKVKYRFVIEMLIFIYHCALKYLIYY